VVAFQQFIGPKGQVVVAFQPLNAVSNCSIVVESVEGIIKVVCKILLYVGPKGASGFDEEWWRKEYTQ
jgi:hypothetical protein